MKPLKHIILILLFTLLIGCDGRPLYEGLIVHDAQGRIFRLRHHLGGAYFPDPIDTNSVTMRAEK